MAARTLRRCSTGLLDGRSSRAAWLSGRCPVARSASTDLTVLRLSQCNTVAGRSTVASVWCRTCSSGRIWPLVSARSSLSCWWRWQRRQTPAMRPPLAPQVGQVFQKSGSGTAQPAHNGACRVPARTAPSCPQREHSAQERAHAPHHGCPVVLDTMQGTVRPHTLQDASFRGRQVAQIGPSTARVLTRCRRPQRMHSSRLIGSLTRQLGHNGSPRASRAAGSRTPPQREQGTALALATQLRQLHCPCRRRCRRTIRWQCGQAGRMICAAPAAQSSSISRSTAEVGACAPSPVSRLGLSSTAHARRRRLPCRVNTRRAASATVSADSEGSRRAMMVVSTISGSRSSPSGHRSQRGCPARSRLATGRCWPQDAHGRSDNWRTQTEQYQSWPWRCIEASSRPQVAHRGGETLVAPAARSASRRSPTAVGAGERPLVSTDASPASAAAKRRRLARPPLLCSTTWRTVSWSSVASTAVTTATTVPIGSTSASSPGCVIGRSE